MKFAIVEDNKVVNIVVSDIALGDNWISTSTAAIGDSYVDGVFLSIDQRSLEELKDDKWREIKSLRDNLTQTGGYMVSGKWFHSDTFSRSQQLGLVMLGSNIPSGLMWKTMDGSFVEMTPTLAQEIYQAATIQDSSIFAHAENINKQIQDSSDTEFILNFDITQGWPETYSPQ